MRTQLRPHSGLPATRKLMAMGTNSLSPAMRDRSQFYLLAHTRMRQYQPTLCLLLGSKLSTPLMQTAHKFYSTSAKRFPNSVLRENLPLPSLVMRSVRIDKREKSLPLVWKLSMGAYVCVYACAYVCVHKHSLAHTHTALILSLSVPRICV